MRPNLRRSTHLYWNTMSLIAAVAFVVVVAVETNLHQKLIDFEWVRVLVYRICLIDRWTVEAPQRYSNFVRLIVHRIYWSKALAEQVGKHRKYFPRFVRAELVDQRYCYLQCRHWHQKSSVAVVAVVVVVRPCLRTSAWYCLTEQIYYCWPVEPNYCCRKSMSMHWHRM